MDPHPHSPPKLILAIDDEPEILDIIKACLEMEGFQVLTALGAKAGLKLYETRGSEIGVVLLDYLMPDMTGDLVFECLRQKNPDTRVILLTGWGAFMKQDGDLPAQVDGVLSKPPRARELRETLKRLAPKSRSRTLAA